MNVPWRRLLTIGAFSILAVYSTAQSLHTIDIDTGVAASDISTREYNQVLTGERGFPYQWRVLGAYLVYGGVRLTGAQPHAVDLVLKVLLLWTSAAILFAYARAYTTEAGAYGVLGLYLLLTVVGFTDEQYRIYFTNDYLMLVCWFAAVLLIRAGRYPAAAAVTFVGAFAKETMLLVPVLMALESLRSRRAAYGLALTAAAFLVPTVILRVVYPAPFAKWAWWNMVYANVPFLQSSMYDFALTIKNNVKVLFFYNVFWYLAARRVVTLAEPFARNVAITCIVYLVLAYPVIYIRELRHFLPLAIAILPLAINAIEAKRADRPTDVVSAAR